MNLSLSLLVVLALGALAPGIDAAAAVVAGRPGSGQPATAHRAAPHPQGQAGAVKSPVKARGSHARAATATNKQPMTAAHFTPTVSAGAGSRRTTMPAGIGGPVRYDARHGAVIDGTVLRRKP